MGRWCRHRSVAERDLRFETCCHAWPNRRHDSSGGKVSFSVLGLVSVRAVAVASVRPRLTARVHCLDAPPAATALLAVRIPAVRTRL